MIYIFGLLLVCDECADLYPRQGNNNILLLLLFIILTIFVLYCITIYLSEIILDLLDYIIGKYIIYPYNSFIFNIVSYFILLNLLIQIHSSFSGQPIKIDFNTLLILVIFSFSFFLIYILIINRKYRKYNELLGNLLYTETIYTNNINDYINILVRIHDNMDLCFINKNIYYSMIYKYNNLKNNNTELNNIDDVKIIINKIDEFIIMEKQYKECDWIEFIKKLKLYRKIKGL